jgi:hypothetical protein
VIRGVGPAVVEANEASGPASTAAILGTFWKS